MVDRGGDGDMPDLAERLVVEQIGVEPGQLAPRAAADEDDVRRADRAAAGERDRAVARDAEAAAGIGPVEIGAAQPFGDGADRAVEPDPRHLASRHDRHIGRRSRGRPRPRPARSTLRSSDAVSARGFEPSRVHHVEQVVLVGAVLAVVEAGIGDQPPVGRHRRLGVGPVAMGERIDPAPMRCRAHRPRC